MGVIRWKKVFGIDFGEVGDGSICRVFDALTGWRLELYPAFPGRKAGQLIYDNADLRFNTKALAKEYAERLLQEWLDAAGLAPKQRTAVDLGNAEIIANGYVTFRDGGAA